jgi:BirA family biotin operon repressor/biotin-[acetyl-CoA-carboxylase] ligase
MPKLALWGLEVRAVPGAGYRLARRVDLLDADELRAALAPRTARILADLRVHTEIGSTNGELLESDPPPPGRLSVCIAEYQRAGRGRRGRRWTTPLGGGLCLSVAWQFAATPPDLPALTLAAGVAVRRALARAAGVAVGLKWPNDIVLDERKLGGILLEMAAEAQGRCHVVVGVGINVALPPDSLANLCDWPRGAIDLATAFDRAPPPRRSLAAALIDALAELLAGYATSGFAPFRAEWRAADVLVNRPVRVDDAGRAALGTARAIDDDGALIVETADGACRRVISGDVSVRGA